MDTSRYTETRKRVRKEVDDFLMENIPQIRMHGGEAVIQQIDLDEGRVYLKLGGTCHGCGLSPMTAQVIKSNLPEVVEGVESVSVSTTDL